MLCLRTGWEPRGAGKGCSGPDAFGPEDGKNCDERKGSLSGGRSLRRSWKRLRAGVHSGEGGGKRFREAGFPACQSRHANERLGKPMKGPGELYR